MNRGGVCAGRHEYIPVGSPPASWPPDARANPSPVHARTPIPSFGNGVPVPSPMLIEACHCLGMGWGRLWSTVWRHGCRRRAYREVFTACRRKPPPTHAFSGSFNYRPSINAESLLVSFALTLALSGKRERRLFGALSSSAVQGRAGAARQCHVEAWPSRQGAWRRLGGRPSELGRPASVALDFLEDRIVGARSAGGGAGTIPGPVAQFLDLLAHGSGQRHDLSGVLYHVLGSE